MLVFSLAIAAFAASTTFATPLKSSWSKKVEANPQSGSLPRLIGRDVNDVQLTQLPTCRPDALYQFFVDPENIMSASAFCSIYIAAESLVRATVTPTYTATISVPATGAVTTENASANDTVTSETCSYSNATVVPATSISLEATNTSVPTPQKKQALPVPPLLTETYGQLRLSSVCSCLVTPATIVTTLTSTAPPEWETEMHTVPETANVPLTQNSTAVTATTIPPFQNFTTGTADSASQTASNIASTGIPPFQNGTAGTTVTTLPAPNTAETTATIFGSGNNTVEATATAFPSGTNTTNATSTISGSGDNTVEATVTISQSQNTTATAGLPGPTGTNTSASGAYCSQSFIRGNGTFLARYTVRCGYSYTNLDPMSVGSHPSYEACVQECDNNSRCYAYSYLLSGDADNCYIYNYYPLPDGQPDELFDSGSYVVGSNNGMKH